MEGPGERWNKVYDNITQSVYRYHDMNWISYEDPTTIRAKVRWVEEGVRVCVMCV